MPGQGYARSGAIRVTEVCCKDVIFVDVTWSLTDVTAQCGGASGLLLWWLPALTGLADGQLPAFGEPVGVSYPHSGRRWARATRIRGAGGRQLSAFGESVDLSYPHSGSR